MSEGSSETKQINSLSDVRHDALRHDESALINFDNLPVGAVLEVQTESRTYLLENTGNGQVRMKGHPRYCPDPILVTLCNSMGGDQAPSPLVIGSGLLLIYWHPTAGLVRTSPIVQVRLIEKSVSVTEGGTDT